MSDRNDHGIHTTPHSFKGVWTAIATPFRDSGALDVSAFAKLLELQSGEKPVTGIVVAGTTGEAPTLTLQEKKDLVRLARRTLPRGIRVMAGSGTNNTEESIEISKLLLEAGADSLLIVTPPYNKPNPAGLTEHFQKIGDSVGAPLCLYHVPGRTGQFLRPEAIADLCALPSVAACKEASGDIAFFSRAKIAAREKSAFLSGDDPTYLASLAVGGQGCISVISNIFPKAYVTLTERFLAGDFQGALALHETLLLATDILFCESNPCPLKAALHALGYCENRLRLPLASVTRGNYAKITSVIKETRERLRDENLA